MLNRFPPAGLVVALVLWTGSAWSADDYQLESVATAPEDLAEEFASQVAAAGVRISGPKRELLQLWPVKSVKIAADFQPTAAVKYPFSSGELVAVMQVLRRSGLTDFRGNEIEKGTYTLRYGRQPTDGNHIGTSDLADFLVAIPAEDDESPAPIDDLQTLYELSAKASGTPHPAIFSLQPVASPGKEPSLTHDEERGFWILQLNIPPQSGDKSKPQPLRVVVVGQSEG